jgi:hypothetical protein
MRRPAMAGAALATCFGQPVTEHAGGWKRCGWLTGRQRVLSRLGQRVRLERPPRPGARAPARPGIPVTLADRPSASLPATVNGHACGPMSRGVSRPVADAADVGPGVPRPAGADAPSLCCLHRSVMWQNGQHRPDESGILPKSAHFAHQAGSTSPGGGAHAWFAASAAVGGAGFPAGSQILTAPDPPSLSSRPGWVSRLRCAGIRREVRPWGSNAAMWRWLRERRRW